MKSYWIKFNGLTDKINIYMKKCIKMVLTLVKVYILSFLCSRLMMISSIKVTVDITRLPWGENMFSLFQINPAFYFYCLEERSLCLFCVDVMSNGESWKLKHYQSNYSNYSLLSFHLAEIEYSLILVSYGKNRKN